jgi:curved DNA-binding protein CbpA
MARFDPYAVLGVGRTATAGAIKSAYRKLVQSVHPDRGGDPDEFIAVVKAFGLLSDPEARHLFDETGIVDEEGVRNYRRDVAVILADMFDTAVATAIATGLKLEEVNFVREMTVAVQSSVTETRAMLKRTDAEIGALQKLMRRIQRRDEGANLFVERLETQIGNKTEHHMVVKRRLMVLEAAVVELGNYHSEVELIAALEQAQG